MAEPILVVTGPSGVGKTTVARLVAAAYDPSVHIAVDTFTPFVVNGWIDPSRPESAQQNDVLGAAVAGAAMAFAVGGYTVIFDGYLFPDGLEGLATMCRARGVPLHYCVLRSDLETCVARATHRAANPDFRPEIRYAGFDIGDRQDLASFVHLHARFKLAGPEEKIIDATSAPDSIAEAVLAAFASGRLRVV